MEFTREDLLAMEEKLETDIYRPVRRFFNFVCASYQARFYIFIIEALKANSKYHRN